MTDHSTILPMDPKQQINQLDPKLKEAYERVMGTPVGGAPQQAAAPLNPTNQTPSPTTTQPSSSATPQNPPTQSPQPGQPPVMPHFTTPQPMPQPAMPTAGTNSHIQQNPVANPFGLPSQQPTQAPTPAAPAAPAKDKPAAASHGFVANKKGLHISPLILVFAGFIFLLIYTVFWFKFFNIPLPFIGQ